MISIENVETREDLGSVIDFFNRHIVEKEKLSNEVSELVDCIDYVVRQHRELQQVRQFKTLEDFKNNYEKVFDYLFIFLDPQTYTFKDDLEELGLGHIETIEDLIDHLEDNLKYHLTNLYEEFNSTNNDSVLLNESYEYSRDCIFNNHPTLDFFNPMEVLKKVCNGLVEYSTPTEFLVNVEL